MVNKVRKYFFSFDWDYQGLIFPYCYQKRAYKLLRKMMVLDLKNLIIKKEVIREVIK